jgi:hypothetical protein
MNPGFYMSLAFVLAVLLANFTIWGIGRLRGRATVFWGKVEVDPGYSDPRLVRIGWILDKVVDRIGALLVAISITGSTVTHSEFLLLLGYAGIVMVFSHRLFVNACLAFSEPTPATG